MRTVSVALIIWFFFNGGLVLSTGKPFQRGDLSEPIPEEAIEAGNEIIRDFFGSNFSEDNLELGPTRIRPGTGGGFFIGYFYKVEGIDYSEKLKLYVTLSDTLEVINTESSPALSQGVENLPPFPLGRSEIIENAVAAGMTPGKTYPCRDGSFVDGFCTRVVYDRETRRFVWRVENILSGEWGKQFSGRSARVDPVNGRVYPIRLWQFTY